MPASDVIATSSIVIAVLALVVSVYQLMLTRQHNRRSVRPALQLDTRFRPGEQSGLLLTNVGLGPAVITGSTVYLDEQELGPWDQRTSDVLRGEARDRPSATTFIPGMMLTTDYQEFLLSVTDYNPAVDWHTALRTVIDHRIRFVITYESLYGDSWTATGPI